MTEWEKPLGVAVAVTSRMCQRTADAFPTLVLLLGPAAFSSSWPHPLGQLTSHPPRGWSLSVCLFSLAAAACSASCPPLSRLSHCWLWQHQLGAHTNKPSKIPYLGSLPSLPLPCAVSSPHWSFGEISVFLIYHKTNGKGPKPQLLTIIAALLTLSRAKAGLSVYWL